MRNLSLLSTAALSSAVLLISAAWSLSARGNELPPTITLPTPTGPFPVGRTIYEWTDIARDEIYSEVEGERRSVLVWIWYPAEASDAPASEYLPTGLADFVEEAIGLPSHAIITATRDHAPVAVTSEPLPVLVFSHGSGSLTAIYTALLTELASHGYVVAAIQHPYNAMITMFSDGRAVGISPRASMDSVQYWSEDTSFVVDELEKLSAGPGRFAGRLSFTRLGAFGHSFGGAAAAEFCLHDVRCKAGIDFDGSLSGDVETVGAGQPFMQVLSGTNCEEIAATGGMSLAECAPLFQRYEAGWQRLFEASEAGYRVTIGGARHGSFSDLPFLAVLVPMFAEPAATITPERIHEISTQYALAFFDRHLNGTSGPLPDFPEATVEVSRRR